MKHLLITKSVQHSVGFLFSLLCLVSVANARMVTFRVDMTGQTVGVNGVRIGGNFRDVNYDGIAENPLFLNWDPAAITLSNVANIYSVTLNLLDNRAYEFKFINGNTWANVELIPATSRVNTSNDNRWVYIPTGTDTLILPAIRFSQNAPLGKIAVALSVDTRDLLIASTGVRIGGTFNGFNQTSISNYISDGNLNGNVYRTIVYPDSNTMVHFKFLNGIDGWEEIPMRCGTGTVFNYRVFVADSTKTMSRVCFGQCMSCVYPNLSIDTAQFVSSIKLSSIPVNDTADYISPIFRNATFRDTISFTGLVVFNPAIYGLSVNRKATYLQRRGGGPWSGVQVMLEPVGTGLTVPSFNTETQFYNKAKRGQVINVKGLIRQFQSETQVNILRNGIDSAITTMNPLSAQQPVYSLLKIDSLNTGGAVGGTPLLQQKLRGEKWEGVLVQFNNVVVDAITASGSRFFWNVRDDAGNAIAISDFSAFYRNDNNEDSTIANTYAPPAIGTRLSYVRGIVREATVSSIQQYQLSPLYPEDIGAPVPSYPTNSTSISMVNPAFSAPTRIVSITSPSASTVWVIGKDTAPSATGNRISKSTNGGTSWTTYSIAGFPTFTPSCISALNADTAWVSMYNSTGGGAVFRTVNGGTTWTQQTTAAFSSPNGFPNFVHFFDKDNGLVAGDPNGGFFEIYTTTNGGTSWSRVSSANIPANLAGEYGTTNKFTSAGNSFYFTTTEGRLLRSFNRGLNWSLSSIIYNGSPTIVRWVQAKSSTNIIAAVYSDNFQRNLMAESFDGGNTWNIFDWNALMGFTNTAYVKLAGDAGKFVIMADGIIQASYNNGRNWLDFSQPLNNLGMSDGAMASIDGILWMGGNYLNASNTGLRKFTITNRDITPLATIVSGGKNACYTNSETVQVQLLNSGSSAIRFDSTNASIRYDISKWLPGLQAFTLDTTIVASITNGLLNPGEVITHSGGGIPINSGEYLVQAIVTLNDGNASTRWNDTSNLSYFDGVVSATLFNSSNQATTRLTAGTTGRLFCAGSFTDIQWQSLNENGQWVNENGAIAQQNNFTFTATQAKTYRAVVCGGSIISNNIQVAILQKRFVRISVNMLGTSISMNGVRVVGNFRDVNYDGIAENSALNNWDTISNVLTNGGSGTVYSRTLELASNIAYELKFINGNSLSFIETVPSLSRVSSSNNNRWFFVPDGTDTLQLPAIRFGQNAPIGKAAIRLTVDTRDLSISNQGILIAGTYNGFNQTPISNYTTDGNFGTSDYRTIIYPDTNAIVSYKFLNGRNGWEEIPLSCGNGTLLNERRVIADSSKTLSKVCFAQCTICNYPLTLVDTTQFVSMNKLQQTPFIDIADYINPTFRNATYTDTIMVTGTVVFNPALYGLSTARKATYIQRKGGGPWSGVQVMLEPAGTGLTVGTFNSETQFYNKAKRGNTISVKGVIRQFQNETQLNILRNGLDSSVVAMNSLGGDNLVYSVIPINELTQGGAGGTLVGTQRKVSGEKWEGVLVQFNNVVVDTVYANGASRFFWKVRDENGNAIWISDFSGFYRNDNNEDSAIANTYAPPLRGRRLQYIRGAVREVIVSSNSQYQLAPLYPNDVGPAISYPLVSIDSLQFVNNSKLNSLPANDTPDYVSPVFANPQSRDTIITQGIVLMSPRIYGLSASRRSTFIQRRGGGAWSGIEMMADTIRTPGFTQNALLNNTQFFNKSRVGNEVRYTGLLSQFQSHTQVYLLPNGLDSSVLIQNIGNTPVSTTVPINEMMMGGVTTTNGTQQKVTGEKWENVYVQLNDITIDTVMPVGTTRFMWKLRDDFGNAIWVRDHSAFFRNDNNEDSLIANTFLPPVKGTRLFYLKGVITDVIYNGVPQYLISPLHPSDIGPINPVPVSFLYFKGQNQEKGVRLDWATASEINNNHFEIERSINNMDYETIGLVKGKGNSNIKNSYGLFDEDAKALLKDNSTLYYRLKQVDFNQEFEYSNTVVVYSKMEEASFQVMPNPANMFIEVKGLNQPAIISDITGRVIMQITTNGTINISHLMDGMYFIRSGNKSSKFIKE